MEPIRLLMADDHLLLLEALATRFTTVEGFAVVAALADSAAVGPAAVKTRPDVALLDVFMPPDGGIAAARQLRKLLPSCGVVLMTAVPRPGLLSRAIEDGVLGVVRKSAPLAELVPVLHAAAAGQRRIDPAIDAAIGTLDRSPLSCREAEVLRLAMTGVSIAELAKRVCLAEGTVRNLVSASMKKLNARNRFDAARIALEQGLLLTLARPAGRRGLRRRSQRALVQQAVAFGEHPGLETAPRAEALHHRFDDAAGRARADPEPLRDRLVGVTLSQQPDGFHLQGDAHLVPLPRARVDRYGSFPDPVEK